VPGSDVTLICRDCNSRFTFTAGEQQYYATHGLTHQPSRCPNCRQARKAPGAAAGGNRPSHEAVCAECGTWACNGAKPGTAPAGTVFALRAGTLDDTSWLRPTVHFWTRSAQPWIILPEGDTRFETQPVDGAAWLQSIGNHQRRSDH